MSVCVGDLDQRQVERLRMEMVEALAANYAYPPFFDYRSGRTLVRPVDRARREEIDQFIRSVNFSSVERVDVASPEIRRFLEQLFLRYLDVNATFSRPRLARRLPDMRSRAPRMAAEVQRGLLAWLTGGAPSFGARRQQLSWAASGGGRHFEREDAAHNTRVLETILMRRDDAPDAPYSPPVRPEIHAPDPVSPAVPPSAVQVQPTPAPWTGSMGDATVPVTAYGGILPLSQSPFAGLEAGAQSAVFGVSSISERPTGPMEVVRPHESVASASPPNQADQGEGVGPRELPPDLYQLYGDYLRDMQPEAAAVTPATATEVGTATVPTAVPASMHPMPATVSQQAPATPVRAAGSVDTRSDKLIFWQLRYQLEAYVRRAARSYSVHATSADPSGVLDALRRSGHVDEADLRIAEGILALTDRVTAVGGATTEDYRQALMLYLLYHRSHLSG